MWYCGTAVNPLAVEGQVEGAVVMGMSETLLENEVFDHQGRMVNPDLHNYLIATSMDMPHIDSSLVDSWEPEGPFGAKEVGEGSTVPVLGSIANAIRTKYRSTDKPLSRRGASLVHDSGIHAIIHGHRSLNAGQRIALRKDMVNFECDITMDRHSRRREGLKGAGAGVTVVHPDGHITGISSDYPRAKVFDPRNLSLIA